ncbi:ribonuclease P protein subunit p20 [Halyomorpha halys]|uniref:ribonuclease P protein subunit p20 n=1 Tax=Halyomorpha halys TaxID=286706 RepID=UPI0006D50B42|nr:ribonuclease P protein subunit p20-like [Halyomorpha halys]
MDEDSSKSLPKPSHIKPYYKRQRYKSDSDQIVKRRNPPKDNRGPNDIYITNNSDFKGQLARCIKALDKGESEIVLCGLGAAVPIAINLALQLEDKYSGSYSLDVHTNTIHFVDELESASNAHETRIQNRCNSAVKIRVYKINE